MAVLLVRLDHDQYAKWSNTTDSPVSYVMSRDELISNLEIEDHLAEAEAASLLDQAEESGTSDPATSLDVLLAANRAGPNEATLTVNEIIAQYQRG